jgi:hypothetical protein
MCSLNLVEERFKNHIKEKYKELQVFLVVVVLGFELTCKTGALLLEPHLQPSKNLLKPHNLPAGVTQEYSCIFGSVVNPAM